MPFGERIGVVRIYDCPDRLPERKMEFRMGIHLGDVRVEGERLFGDGVNIAARLQGLAEPGGVSISGEVYTQVRNQLDLEYEDMGEQKVKNLFTIDRNANFG